MIGNSVTRLVLVAKKAGDEACCSVDLSAFSPHQSHNANVQKLQRIVKLFQLTFNPSFAHSNET
jgi:hypothetical protein